MAPLQESPYSFHFNILVYLGAWKPNSRNPTVINLNVAYRVVILILEFVGGHGLIMDLLYVSFGNMKKMSWNICITCLLVSEVLKSQFLLHKNEMLTRLRLRLHRDEESRESREESEVALKELKVLRFVFYMTAVIFIPTWLFTKYFLNEEIPIPYRLPDHVNLNDRTEFNVVFVGVSAAGMFGLALAIELQLAMFGILIQISREYRMLMKEIPKLSEDHEGKKMAEKRQEVNPWLRQIKTKELIKRFASRQQELIRYTEDFEICYSMAFLTEFFGLCLVILAVSMLGLVGAGDFLVDYVYQLGYLSLIIVDLFSVCWYATRIQSQCRQVGEMVYSTHWYAMSPDLKRDLSLIILRSQHPPKITTGKLMELNLKSFMMRMGNVYSWLTMLRQLEFKISNGSQGT